MTTCITKSLSHLCHLREIIGLLKFDKTLVLAGAAVLVIACHVIKV